VVADGEDFSFFEELSIPKNDDFLFFAIFLEVNFLKLADTSKMQPDFTVDVLLFREKLSKNDLFQSPFFYRTKVASWFLSLSARNAGLASPII
jgi:hypothetical protein